MNWLGDLATRTQAQSGTRAPGISGVDTLRNKPYLLPMGENNTITAVPGIKVGHAQDLDALTGVTVVLCEKGATGAVDMRGTATGTREINPLSPTHLVEKVFGICLAGGSAFGLDAAGGVMKHLEEKGIGFPVGKTVVPIIPSAILFDLNVGDHTVRPDLAMGYAASEAATDDPAAEGCVGAGTGATVGKLLSNASAMKSGISSLGQIFDDGLAMGAIVAVNAFGDIIDPDSGKILAGSRDPDNPGKFIDTAKALSDGSIDRAFGSMNTTLAVVATNALLTKAQAMKIAQMAQIGFAKTISPCHSIVDGDVIFTLATGEWDGPVSVNRLGILAAEMVARVVVGAVKAAEPMGGLPSCKSFHKSV